MKTNLFFFLVLCSCAPTVGAQEVPLPENLKSHVLYRNGFDTKESLRDSGCKWKIRTDRSGIKPDGITGSCIVFESGSTGWQVSGEGLAPGKAKTLSVWFKTDKEFPAGAELRMLDNSANRPSGDSKRPGVLSMFVMDRMSGLKKPGIFLQAYHLPGCTNLHHAASRDFNQDCRPGQWHHAAITCNGKTIAYYLDGKLLKQKSLETSLPPEPEPGGILFGRSIGTASQFDEFIMFDTALDETVIREYYEFVSVLLARKELL